MKDIISNLIIPPWDSRYGKLGHLKKKYSYEDLVYKEGRSVYFYIPKELVLNEYLGYSKVIFNPEECWDNWIYNRDINRVLERSCNITMQDYFDLLILGINNISDRPKCPICGNPIGFYSIYYGYGSPYTPWIEKQSLCCSKSCSDILRWRNEDDYFNSQEYREILRETCLKLWDEGIFSYEKMFDLTELWKGESGEYRRKLFSEKWKDPRLRNYIDMQRFISKGYEEAYFYVTWTESGYLKFGVTSNLDSRFRTSRKEDPYLNLHVILKSTGEEVAYLESSIKRFTESEYLDPSDLGYLFNLMKSFLADRPIANPFE